LLFKTFLAPIPR